MATNSHAVTVAILCIALTAGSCASMRPVELAKSTTLDARVRPNDKVRVWLDDGRRMDLIVTSVAPDALEARPQRIERKDIEHLSARKVL